METSIKQLSPVEYELDIRADNETLGPRIDQAMRKYRGTLNMKGFRPGKVPMGLVKKMYGKAMAVEIAEAFIQETFEAEVVNNDAYNVLGPPSIDHVHYEPFGELHATVQFGVQPEFELAALADEEITRLTYEVVDRDLEEEFETLRARLADLVPHDEPAGEEDLVIADFQRLDLETDTPIIGDKMEDITVYLGNPNTVDELKTALTGTRAGDSVKATLLPPVADADDLDPLGPRRYRITVKEVKRRELPDLDDDFAKEATNEQIETLDELRAEIRRQLEERWAAALREDLEARITARMTELHPFPVPTAVVDSYQDAFIEDIKNENEGSLPDGFDEAGYRKNTRESAENLVRWLLIRDRLIEQENLSVSPGEMDAHFEDMGKARELSADIMRRMLELYNPNGVDSIERQLLNRKVFNTLVGKFKVVDKPWEEEYPQEEEEEAA